MRKVTIAAAVAALFGLGAAAQAADLGEVSYKDAPIAVSGPVWTGFYVGAGIGASSVINDVDVDLSTPFGSGNVAGVDGIGGEGIFGSVQVGFDKQLGDRIVLGVFADYDFGNAESEVEVLDTEVLGLELENSWSVGARLGYLVNPNTLFYGLVAYTQASFEDSGLLADFVDADDFSGWTVGAGLETNLSGNWFLKAEYRYTQLDSEEVFDESLGPLNVTADMEPSIHSARVGVSYKFNFGDRYDSLK